LNILLDLKKLALFDKPVMILLLVEPRLVGLTMVYYLLQITTLKFKLLILIFVLLFYLLFFYRDDGLKGTGLTPNFLVPDKLLLVNSLLL
jgi:hypothetical protein